MRTTLGRFVVALVSAIAGCVVGYFLSFPPFSVPASAIPPALVPPLKALDAFLSGIGAWFATLPLLMFLLNLPNTLVLSLATSVALGKLAIPRRPVLYSVLAVPALVYLSYWHEVWLLQRGAAALGAPATIDRLPTNPYMGSNAVLMLLTYGCYFLTVFVMLRWTSRSEGG